MINTGIMSEEAFDEIIASKKVCVCDFSATWCGPCRLLAPVIEDVSDKYKGKYYFYQIDIDSAEELSNRYNISVVPTIIVFKDGVEAGRVSGYMDADELEKFINGCLEK